MNFSKKAISLAGILLIVVQSLPAQVRQTREEYIDRYKSIAVAHMERYGIPASITMAQGILESDCGNSWLSLQSNNHFGIKCKRNWTGDKVYYDDDAKGECFRSYPSVEASYRDHAEFLDSQPRYDSLFAYSSDDYKSWARGLKAAGYATAPDYAQRLIRIIEENQLFLLDRPDGARLYASRYGLKRDPEEWFSSQSSVEELARTEGAVDPDNYRVTINAHQGYNVYVTNGVHFPTWIASSLRRLYARYFGDGFEGHVYDIPAWQKVHDIPDAELWEERMKLKNKLIKHIRKRYSDPSQVRLDSPRQMLQVIEGIKPDVLTIGFARRFATYKRAYLLFTNLDRLSAIVNNKERPVQFIFAGKAHPNDKPGQDLIKRIVEVAAMPQFVGKILFLQNYDMELARRMVQGVDVWLNTPTRPLEASGTSGEKCVMNGVLQFSVLDGWWVEGYKEGAGWMLPMERTFADQHYQDELDAEMIYNTIEEQIVPKYYDRDKDGIPHAWVESVKKCVADIASNFTTNRMLNDYEERFYNKLAARKHRIVEGGYKLAREIAAWKRKVSSVWDQIRVIDVQRVKIDNKAIFVGEKYHFEVTVDIVSLRPEDIGVEMVIAQQIVGGQNANVMRTIGLKHTKTEGSRVTYALDYTPDEAGTFDVALRIFPENPHLPHRMDFALVKWA